MSARHQYRLRKQTQPENNQHVRIQGHLPKDKRSENESEGNVNKSQRFIGNHRDHAPQIYSRHQTMHGCHQ